jgi:hypothetical protein
MNPTVTFLSQHNPGGGTLAHEYSMKSRTLAPNQSYYEGDSINKVMFLISFKFPARSEQVEHCFLSRTLDRPSYQSYCPNISCKMTGLAETRSNNEVSSVIRFLRLKGTSPAEIHRQFVEVSCCEDASYCCTITPGHTEPTARVSCYGATIGRYWTILPTALT